MKYRIRITTYRNGRMAYTAQCKRFFRWNTIGCDGDTYAINSCHFGEVSDPEEALRRIRLHIDGNKEIKSIKFDYITK